jgi:uncharacterized SAM-binding protein YcdF (DUF218 family)
VPRDKPTLRELPPEVLADARTLWDYHRLGEPYPSAVDVIVGLGSYDPGVAEHCAHLLMAGQAPWLVFSGLGPSSVTSVAPDPHSKRLLSPWSEPEAQAFRRIAVACGADPARILLEPRSTNTGENLRFSRVLLDERNIAGERLLIVTKPNMERRARATARIELRGRDVFVTSPPAEFEAYCLQRFPPDLIFNLMVGDLQRIAVYGRTGLQAPEEIPEPVRLAFERLVRTGYGRHLIPGQAGL